MGHRLTRIFTRTGDDGSTGLADGSRLNKDHVRIKVIGDIDELNSFIGLLLCEELPSEISAALNDIQHDLFDLGAEFAIPNRKNITEEQVLHLENLLQNFNGNLPPLKEFILPGGTCAAALSHVCRTVCRRAERHMVQLFHQEQTMSDALKYINRLSDLFFVLARTINKHLNQPDIMWQPGRNKSVT